MVLFGAQSAVSTSAQSGGHSRTDWQWWGGGGGGMQDWLTVGGGGGMQDRLTVRGGCRTDWQWAEGGGDAGQTDSGGGGMQDRLTVSGGGGGCRTDWQWGGGDAGQTDSGGGGDAGDRQWGGMQDRLTFWQWGRWQTWGTGVRALTGQAGSLLTPCPDGTGWLTTHTVPWRDRLTHYSHRALTGQADSLLTPCPGGTGWLTACRDGTGWLTTHCATHSYSQAGVARSAPATHYSGHGPDNLSRNPPHKHPPVAAPSPPAPSPFLVDARHGQRSCRLNREPHNVSCFVLCLIWENKYADFFDFF